MLGDKPSTILSAIGGVITRRTSVMTPLIIINFLLGAIAVGIYLIRGAWFGFIFLAVSLVFTMLKYDKFAKTAPWMLSGEKIQKYGMQLTLGDSSNKLTQEEVTELKPVDNPELKKKAVGDGDRLS